MTQSETHTPAHVTLLMGVHNGARYLPAQLDSLARQSHTDWQLICSDDGSVDDSSDIIQTFAKKSAQRVVLRSGPRQGFAQNYLHLIENLSADTGYVALCDQDDIWMPHKLSQGLKALAGQDDQPAFYCGRQCYWSGTMHRKNASPQMSRACSFQNALVENIATGNTILLNPAAARLARDTAKQAKGVFAHDWWLYLLITGTGGKIIFDNGEPAILYRQHNSNMIGAGQTMDAKLRRKVGVLRGLYSARINGNLAALDRIHPLLTSDAKATLDTFVAARERRGTTRLSALRKSGAYRQHWQGNLGLWGAMSLGKV